MSERSHREIMEDVRGGRSGASSILISVATLKLLPHRPSPSGNRQPRSLVVTKTAAAQRRSRVEGGAAADDDHPACPA
jgi:hypothetical protein